jgi:Fe2+ or Zn2+ uptake regulation protein
MEQSELKNLDESSIYRNISKLLEAKIIHEVPSSGDTKFYEILNPEDHHHHITCTQCDTISCLHDCMIDEQISKMAKKVGFAIDGHTLELYGTCKKCQ